MGRIFLFISCLAPMLVTMCLATQTFAESIHYDPVFLGEPWFYHVYPPWAIFDWYSKYDLYVGELLFEPMLYIFAGILFSGFLLFLFRPQQVLTSHGSAHWASDSDVNKMDLISAHGCVIGLYDPPIKRAFTSLLRAMENRKKEKVAYAEMEYDKKMNKEIDRRRLHLNRMENQLEAIENDELLAKDKVETLGKNEKPLTEEEKKQALEDTDKLKKQIAKQEKQKAILERKIAARKKWLAAPPSFDDKKDGGWFLYYCYVWPFKKLSKLYKLMPHFYLRDNSNKHLAVIAPTRSGKGVGLIVPTLLGGWTESCIVNDIKSENWGITAGYRKKMGQKVIKFEPTSDDGSTARWNPLDEIRIGDPNEVSMAQNLAAIIADYEGKGKPDHWVANAGNVIMAVILHLKYAHFADPVNYPRSPNLYTVAAFLKATSEENDQGQINVKGFTETLTDLQTYHHIPDEGLKIKEWDTKKAAYVERLFTKDDLKALYPDAPSLDFPSLAYTHPIISQAFSEIISKPENELGSIVSTANTALKEYLDPLLAANTSTSDFCIDDLMNYKRPVTLYLVTPPSDLLRLAPIFRLFFEMMVRHHARKIGTYVNGQAKTLYKHKCLFLMDEFSSLGNLQSFAATLSYIAGYGMKVFLINQGLPQINGIYGKDNQILMNCHLQIFYAPNDNDTGKYAESLLGNKTITTTSVSDNGGFTFKKNYSRSQTGRALMTADELKRLGDQEIIVASGSPPVLTDKIKYYEHKFFTEKLCDAPVVSDVIRDPEKYPIENGNPAREKLLQKMKQKEEEKWDMKTTFTNPADAKNKETKEREVK